MKDLKEHMQMALNESRIKNTEITNYIKSWMMEVTNEDAARDMIMAIELGINTAIKERNKYMHDDNDKAATKVFEKTSRAIGELQF